MPDATRFRRIPRRLRDPLPAPRPYSRGRGARGAEGGGRGRQGCDGTKRTADWRSRPCPRPRPPTFTFVLFCTVYFYNSLKLQKLLGSAPGTGSALFQNRGLHPPILGLYPSVCLSGFTTGATDNRDNFQIYPWLKCKTTYVSIAVFQNFHSYFMFSKRSKPNFYIEIYAECSAEGDEKSRKFSRKYMD